MKLEEVYKIFFDQRDDQWRAFKEICRLMGCGKSFAVLLKKEYDCVHQALFELNLVLQQYLFRQGQHNPFGVAKERYEIEGDLTELHVQVADQLICLGVHHAKCPNEYFNADAVFILGSTVHNMAQRIEFYLSQVLPFIKTVPQVYGLSGERVLIPAKSDVEGVYFGDVSERAVPGQHLFLTRAELEPTLADYHKAGQPTEAGALSILMNRLIKKGAVQIINARPKLGRSRLDTEDTGLCAAQLLQGKSLENFRLVIVSHACFQGQKEQILSGFLRAGIHLRKEQVEFYGSGYPAERVRNSAAYTQILVSSLAERVYSTMKYLEMEKACAFQEAL